MWTTVLLHGVTQEDVRRTLGLGRGMVARLVYGDVRASLRIAHAIEVAYGIPARLWLDPPATTFSFEDARRQV